MSVLNNTIIHMLLLFFCSVLVLGAVLCFVRTVAFVCHLVLFPIVVFSFFLLLLYYFVTLTFVFVFFTFWFLVFGFWSLVFWLFLKQQAKSYSAAISGQVIFHSPCPWPEFMRKTCL